MRSLSPSLQLALSSDRTEEAISRIATKYKLDQNPTVVTDAVSDVLSGKLNPKNLPDHLSRTGLDKDTSLHIAHELEEEIFERLRPALDPFYTARESTLEQPVRTAQNPLNLKEMERFKKEPSPPSLPLEKLDEHERMPPRITAHENREAVPAPAPPARLPHPGRDQYLEPIGGGEELHPKPRIEGNTIDLSEK